MHLLRSGRHPFIYSNKWSASMDDWWAGHAERELMPLRHKVGPAGCRGNIEQEFWCWRL